VRRVGAVLPIDNGVGIHHGVSEVKRSEMPESTEGGAYRTLREKRSEARLVGVREKRAKLKAEEAEAKKGK
jgi:large subunit ribosomal protein L13e